MSSLQGETEKWEGQMRDISFTEGIINSIENKPVDPMLNTEDDTLIELRRVLKSASIPDARPIKMMLMVGPSRIESDNITVQSISWSTVRASAEVGDSGKWYYEVLVRFTDIAQIGFALDSYVAIEGSHDGVGDDQVSWGVCLNRHQKWHGSNEAYGNGFTWGNGDVLGCLLDLDAGTISYTLNGRDIGKAFDDVRVPSGGCLYPAASLREGTAIFYFDQKMMKYGPPTGYKSFMVCPLIAPLTVQAGRRHLDINKILSAPTPLRTLFGPDTLTNLIDPSLLSVDLRPESVERTFWDFVERTGPWLPGRPYDERINQARELSRAVVSAVAERRCTDMEDQLERMLHDRQKLFIRICSHITHSMDDVRLDNVDVELDQSSPGVVARRFVRAHEFDHQGVVYYLGTSKHASLYETSGERKEWTNPHPSILYATVHPGTMEGKVHDILVSPKPHDRVKFATYGADDAHIQIDFGLTRAFLVTEYSIRFSGQSAYLRNWNFLGSLDGNHFITLMEHRNDRSLSVPWGTRTWSINAKGHFYRYFRIQNVQPGNSINGSNLHVSNIEMYGTLRESESQESLKYLYGTVDVAEPVVEVVPVGDDVAETMAISALDVLVKLIDGQTEITPVFGTDVMNGIKSMLSHIGTGGLLKTHVFITDKLLDALFDFLTKCLKDPRLDEEAKQTVAESLVILSYDRGVFRHVAKTIDALRYEGAPEWCVEWADDSERDISHFSKHGAWKEWKSGIKAPTSLYCDPCVDTYAFIDRRLVELSGAIIDADQEVDYLDAEAFIQVCHLAQGNLGREKSMHGSRTDDKEAITQRMTAIMDLCRTVYDSCAGKDQQCDEVQEVMVACMETINAVLQVMFAKGVGLGETVSTLIKATWTPSSAGIVDVVFGMVRHVAAALALLRSTESEASDGVFASDTDHQFRVFHNPDPCIELSTTLIDLLETQTKNRLRESTSVKGEMLQRAVELIQCGMSVAFGPVQTNGAPFGSDVPLDCRRQIVNRYTCHLLSSVTSVVEAALSILESNEGDVSKLDETLYNSYVGALLPAWLTELSLLHWGEIIEYSTLSKLMELNRTFGKLQSAMGIMPAPLCSDGRASVHWLTDLSILLVSVLTKKLLSFGSMSEPVDTDAPLSNGVNPNDMAAIARFERTDEVATVLSSRLFSHGLVDERALPSVAALVLETNEAEVLLKELAKRAGPRAALVGSVAHVVRSTVSALLGAALHHCALDTNDISETLISMYAAAVTIARSAVDHRLAPDAEDMLPQDLNEEDTAEFLRSVRDRTTFLLDLAPAFDKGYDDDLISVVNAIGDFVLPRADRSTSISVLRTVLTARVERAARRAIGLALSTEILATATGSVSALCRKLLESNLLVHYEHYLDHLEGCGVGREQLVSRAFHRLLKLLHQRQRTNGAVWTSDLPPPPFATLWRESDHEFLQEMQYPQNLLQMAARGVVVPASNEPLVERKKSGWERIRRFVFHTKSQAQVTQAVSPNYREDGFVFVKEGRALYIAPETVAWMLLKALALTAFSEDTSSSELRTSTLSCVLDSLSYYGDKADADALDMHRAYLDANGLQLLSIVAACLPNETSTHKNLEKFFVSKMVTDTLRALFSVWESCPELEVSPAAFALMRRLFKIISPEAADAAASKFAIPVLNLSSLDNPAGYCTVSLLASAVDTGEKGLQILQGPAALLSELQDLSHGLDELGTECDSVSYRVALAAFCRLLAAAAKSNRVVMDVDFDVDFCKWSTSKMLLKTCHIRRVVGTRQPTFELVDPSLQLLVSASALVSMVVRKSQDLQKARLSGEAIAALIDLKGNPLWQPALHQFISQSLSNPHKSWPQKDVKNDDFDVVTAVRASNTALCLIGGYAEIVRSGAHAVNASGAQVMIVRWDAAQDAVVVLSDGASRVESSINLTPRIYHSINESHFDLLLPIVRWHLERKSTTDDSTGTLWQVMRQGALSMRAVTEYLRVFPELSGKKLADEGLLLPMIHASLGAQEGLGSLVAGSLSTAMHAVEESVSSMIQMMVEKHHGVGVETSGEPDTTTRNVTGISDEDMEQMIVISVNFNVPIDFVVNAYKESGHNYEVTVAAVLQACELGLTDVVQPSIPAETAEQISGLGRPVPSVPEGHTIGSTAAAAVQPVLSGRGDTVTFDPSAVTVEKDLMRDMGQWSSDGSQKTIDTPEPRAHPARRRIGRPPPLERLPSGVGIQRMKLFREAKELSEKDYPRELAVAYRKLWSLYSIRGVLMLLEHFPAGQSLDVSSDDVRDIVKLLYMASVIGADDTLIASAVATFFQEDRAAEAIARGLIDEALVALGSEYMEKRYNVCHLIIETALDACVTSPEVLPLVLNPTALNGLVCAAQKLTALPRRRVFSLLTKLLENAKHFPPSLRPSPSLPELDQLRDLFGQAREMTVQGAQSRGAAKILGSEMIQKLAEMLVTASCAEVLWARDADAPVSKKEKAPEVGIHVNGVRTGKGIRAAQAGFPAQYLIEYAGGAPPVGRGLLASMFGSGGGGFAGASCALPLTAEQPYFEARVAKVGKLIGIGVCSSLFDLNKQPGSRGADSVVLMSSGVVQSGIPQSFKLKHTSDFDKNGLFHFLGSGGGAHAFRNPCKQDLVKVTFSNVNQGSPSNICMPPSRVATSAKPHGDEFVSWYKIDISASGSLHPTHYTMGMSGNGSYPRDWKFEASHDGDKWTVLRGHHDDESLNSGWASHTWSIDASEAYEYFRISLTRNSSGRRSALFCANLELYGELHSNVIAAGNVIEPTTYKTMEDYSDDAAYGRYLRRVLRPGMRLRAVNGFESVREGDVGTFTEWNRGTPPCQCQWDGFGSTYWLNWREVEIIDDSTADGEPQGDVSSDDEGDDSRSTAPKRAAKPVQFKSGDRVGCGLELRRNGEPTGTVLFTHNGEVVRSAPITKMPDNGLFPLISLSENGDKVMMDLSAQPPPNALIAETYPTATSALANLRLVAAAANAFCDTSALPVGLRIRRRSNTDNAEEEKRLEGIEVKPTVFMVSSKESSSSGRSILNDDTSTYWQSQGESGRHWILFKFSHRALIESAEYYNNESNDGNYAPSSLDIEIGDEPEQTTPLGRITVPTGSQWINLIPSGVSAPRCRYLRVRIRETHGDGVNCRVRSVRFKLKAIEDEDDSASWLKIATSLYAHGYLDTATTSVALPDDYEDVNDGLSELGEWSFMHDEQLAKMMSEAGAVDVASVDMTPYPLLQHRPTDALSRRIAIIGRFSRLYVQSISLLDLLSDPDTCGRVTQALRQARSLVLAKDKAGVIGSVLRVVKKVEGGDPPFIKVDRAAAHLGRQPKDGSRSLFGQIYTALGPNAKTNKHFRGRDSWWKIEFRGEGGQDYAGLFRESVSCIADDLMSGATPLFIPVPNQRIDVGTLKDSFIPNPSCSLYDQYEFVGRLMGAAIMTDENLTLNFAPFVWKLIAGVMVPWHEYRDIDQTTVQALDEIESMTSQAFEDAYADDLTFTYTSATGRVVELIPNGTNRVVTFDSRCDFVSLVRSMRMSELTKQADAIRRGLVESIPPQVLQLWTSREFERSIGGEPEIDIAVVRRTARYAGGLSETHSLVGMLWEAVEHLNPGERSLFLRFVTGRSRLPVSLRVILQDGGPDALPKSDTCFQTLRLPSYPSTDVLLVKLRYAIHNCMAIDTDGAAADPFGATVV